MTSEELLKAVEALLGDPDLRFEVWDILSGSTSPAFGPDSITGTLMSMRIVLSRRITKEDN